MAGEAPERLRWVKTLACLCRGSAECHPVVEAHHAGRRGMARKAHDDTAVPLCLFHHRQWHDASGPFKEWDQDRRRLWAWAAIHATQSAWEMHRRRVIPDWA